MTKIFDYDQVPILSASNKSFNLTGLRALYSITDNQDFVEKIDQVKA